MTDSAPRPIVVYLIDLQCLQCGRPVGTLRSRSWPSRGLVAFQAAGTRAAVAVVDWTRIRCEICGGNVYADEAKTTRLYPPLSRHDLDAPRRGRPPAWLVAQRLASDDAESD